ncbi:MAG: zinc-ribbon domain-containing protein [Chloroflexota bacterium]
MNLGAFFLVLALALAVTFYIAQPFLERRGRRATAEAHDVSALMAERDRVVNALQELDFDFNLNKIPAEDYPVQRAELLKKGAEVLKKLDELAPNEVGASAEDRVEKAVAARRADLASTSDIVRDDDDVEALIAARRKTRKEKSGGFCPRCGKPVLVSDRFCPHCGKSIA